MQPVFKHENRAILFSAKNILDLHGIETFVKNEHSNTMGPEFGLANIQLELWVLDNAEYTRAADIIEREVVNPPSKPAWTCTHCGEVNAGNFDICWQCQHDNPHSD